MAMELELSQSNYGRLEKDDSRLTAPKLLKIAEVLKVSVAYLFNESIAKIINQHNNQIPSAYNVEHFYNQNQEIHNALINQLKDEISFLRAQLEKAPS